MKKYSNEFKVGIFIILCVAGLLYLTFSTGKVGIKKGGYNIFVVFDEIAGLEKKAPVMLNGLEVGKVEEIKPSYDSDSTHIILKLWLSDEAKIRENPAVSIKTLGLMGEKYIQISSSKGANFIQPESTLEGKPYMDLDTITEQAEGISNEIKKLAASLNFTLENNQDEISRIIANLEATSKNFEEFSQDIKWHPWKLIFKTKEKKPTDKKKK